MMDTIMEVPNMWKDGSWGSVDELFLDNQFPINEEIGSPGKDLLGDEKLATLDGLDRLEGLLDEFLATSTLKNEAKAANSPLDNDEDFFPEWVENKIDFSLLDNLDNLENLLDDPSMVIEEDDPIKLSSENPVEKSQSALGKNSKERNITPIVIPNSPPYSHPSSPEGLVPDVSAPCSPVMASPSNFNDVILPNQLYPSPLPSPLYVTAPTTFTIILPNGDLAGLFTKVEDGADYEIVTSSNIDNDSSGTTYDVLIEQEEVLPLAEESTSNNFEGILKDKPTLKAKEGKSKNTRGKRKSSDAFQTSISNTSVSDDYSPPVPKQRKERKRIQNKDAATRYRQKKKAQAEEIGGVEGQLLDENKTLKDKAQQLSNEISYLKGLMREMFKARGLLK